MTHHRSVTSSAGLLALALTSALSAQSSFNLLANQTPIRNQGSRNTCVTFAAVAALEAAYHRAGYGRLDLSEEFESYAGKMFWLHTNWQDITGPNVTENQVGAFGGGGGTGHVRWLASGMRVPTESDMPYRPGGYDLGAHRSWQDPFWDVQKNVNEFNLDPRNLPRRALTASRYYRGSGFAMLQDPRSTTEIETVLRNRREVVWDFIVRGDRSGAIWHADPNGAVLGGHAMVIVGYDRSDPDPRRHYFICKNSWGPTSNPGGYTYIGYDYVQYGYAAACFTGVRAPGPWADLAFVGRYNLCFDGWRGTLDITHLPGIAQLWLNEAGVTVTDRRIGTFFDSNGQAHRVNGQIQGGELYFWFKGGFPNMRWDDQRESTTGVGRGFHYHLVSTNDGEMAGWHHDNPGLIPNPPIGGYARRPSTILGTDGFLRPSFSGSTPTDVLQYLGTWDLQFDDVAARITFERRDDSIVPAAQRGVWAGLVSHVLEGGTRRPVTALVNISSPRYLDLAFDLADGRRVTTDCYMLTWQRGVFAGAATVGGVTESIYGVRTGAFSSGGFASYGRGCGRGSTPISQTGSGTPQLGSTVYLTLIGQPNLPVALNIGASDTGTTSGLRLPFDLGTWGAPGCQLLAEPLLVQPARTNALGRADIAIRLSDPGLVGVGFYSQFVQLDPAANALGATFSNGVRTRLGD
ncbi:MAG: hypothetical protein IPM29_25995 [Planctomycetes bacterium]|nr:hypothetical protein [Planctomycetota bacterium]